MMLYLARHGEAEPEIVGRERCLTEKGKSDVARVAEYLAGLPIALKQVRHSGKARAAETASILADRLAAGYASEAVDGLAPPDDPHIWADRLQSVEEDIMLVGHLPHLTGLASLLLCGELGRNLIDFRAAGIACLRRTGAGWSIEWVITPDVTP